MERTNLLHQTAIAVLAAAWLFLLLSFSSFHVTDWPSHDVYPYPAIQNLCGSVGAFIAYFSFLAIGQGVFPVLFFTGVCLALLACRSRLSDPWLRVIGLGVLTVAFAAIVHQLRQGSFTGLPEGHGGIVGIATSTYLQSHFSTVGTRLILMSAMMVGLLLAADDLVLRTPGFVAVAYANVKEHTPKLPAMKSFKFNFPSLPKIPSLANFRTKEFKVKPLPAKPKKSKLPAASGVADGPVDDDEDLKPEVLLKITPDSPAIEPAPVTPEPVMSPPEIKRDIVVKLPSMMKPRQVSPPTPPPRELGEYHLPAWDVLENAEYGYAESQETFVREMAAVLEQALKEFNVDAHVVEIDTGPVITMYELALAPGLKVSTITSLTNDIMRSPCAPRASASSPPSPEKTPSVSKCPTRRKKKFASKNSCSSRPRR